MDWMTAVAALDGAPPAPVYVLVGTEPVLVRRFVEQLCRTSGARLGQEVRPLRFAFEEDGADSALMACATVSLFGLLDVVVLEGCTALLASQKANRDTEALEAYLEQPVPDRILVLTVEGEKVDERKRLGKLAKRHVLVNCNTPKDDEAVRVLNWLAKAKSVDVAPAALQELWRRTGSLSLADPELDKAWTYTGGARIEAEHIAELVPARPEDNVFRWMDAVLQGDAERAFRTLHDVRLAGYDPLALMALVARQLRLVSLVRWYGSRGESQAQMAGRLGVHPYAVRVAAGQARRVSAERVERLLCVIADAEYQVKSGRRDPDHAMEWAVMACLAGE
ncbi:MAG: DNA polymerase III subunit delta [Alicyclobacillus sp.]|nr:DNA polymerase III subunit delta [Alicyclobacillus sp.]